MLAIIRLNANPRFALESLQLLLSLVPAPPRGYIHLLSGIPSSFAYSVDVRRQALARLTVLNAFIKRGSGWELRDNLPESRGEIYMENR